MSTLAYEVQSLEVATLEGGLNLRDSLTAVQPNETPRAWNVTLNQRALPEKRLGFQKDGAMTPFASDIRQGFPSKALDAVFLQVGTKLYKRTSAGNFSEVQYSGGDAFTTDDLVGMCDFRTEEVDPNGDPCLVVCHPTDGTFTYLGSGELSLVASDVRGSSCAPWQNRVYVVADPTLPSVIRWCEPGDAGTWDPLNINYIRDTDDERITGVWMAPAAAVSDSVADWKGLIITKERSVHRITDPDTGDYVTVGSDLGCVGPKAGVIYNGRLYFLSERGIARTNGADPPELISGKIEPLFRAPRFEPGDLAEACAWVQHNRIMVSFPIDSEANSMSIEFHPELEWMMPHSIAANCGFEIDRYPYHAFGGYLYRDLTGGDDDGVEIESYLDSASFELGDGIEFNLLRVIVNGRGRSEDLIFSVRSDMDRGNGTVYALDVDVQDDLHEWGEGGLTWGQANLVWAAADHSIYGMVWELGIHRRVQFRFRETSDNALSADSMLGLAASGSVGGWALYSYRMDYVVLGLS